MEKPFDDEFSPSSDCFSISPETSCTRNTLNESYTISKDSYENKTLTVICKENSECYSSNMSFDKSFVSITDLNKCKNMPFADLGKKQVSSSPEFKLEIGDNIEEYYDSDESLGLLPDLLEDLTCDSFSLKIDLNKNLNTTGNISDKVIENFKDCLNCDVKYSYEEMSSPIFNKINISDTQAESPVHCNQYMPNYASTPKQEISNVIDEIISPQYKSDFYLNEIAQGHEEKDCLNKTTIIETGHNPIITNIPALTYLNSDENINCQQNILNTTCNMTNPKSAEEMSLNKTFESLPVLADKYVLPSITDESEQYKISKPNILDKTFEYHSAEFDPSLDKENILNLTCHLDKESDIIGNVCEKFSENPKDDTRKILNTTFSCPSVHDETPFTYNFVTKNKFDINADQSNFQTRDSLNTTYENIEESLKYDANSEKLKCITNLEKNKLLQLGTKTVIKKRRTLSFSVKNVDPEKFEFKNKITEFNRNKNKRKSFSCFGKTATRSNLTEQTSRISIASSTCSMTKVPEIMNISFPKNLPNPAGNINKCSLIYEENEGNMNSSYLKNKTVQYMPLKLSDRKSKIKPKSSQQLLNTIINFHPASDVDETVKSLSKFSSDKSGDIKSASEVDLKDRQESLLNTTINLSPPITDVCKTVVKNRRKTIQIHNAIESCLDSSEDNKSVIPSIQNRGAIKVSQIRVKEMTQKFNEVKTLASSKRIGFKKSSSMEEKKILRLPQRTLSQKTEFQSCCQSSNFKSSNIAKPQTTAGIKPPVTSRKSFFTLTKPSNEGTELAGKAISKDTIPSKKSKEQNIKSIRPPTISRKSTLIKSSNEGTELAGKAISKDTVQSKKNKEQGMETCKKFQSSSKIPSISHFYQQGKTSLFSKRTGATF